MALTGIVVLCAFLPPQVLAAPASDFTRGLTLPKVDFDFERPKDPLASSLQLIMYLTILQLIPYFVVCCTSFIRITIIFSFLKTSLGTTHAPSQQIWIGFAMMLTIFIMAPVFQRIDREALTPYKNKQIQYDEFVGKATKPVMDFMKLNTRQKDLKLFVMLSKPKDPVKLYNNPPFFVLVAAFIISEMKTAFYVGFIIYLPFLCIDMITASVLMSMGMFMLSPMGISLPMKMLTFIMIDGWELLVEGLVRSYRY
ncbi:MAG: flagellar type III secretion system pore protein FliP [Candidatus Eremiobacteraeota bacterium]|nr:flagellar type III secretion system pore protein FliP [Candidatus Eremiobacteraeota bacterium]